MDKRIKSLSSKRKIAPDKRVWYEEKDLKESLIDLRKRFGVYKSDDFFSETINKVIEEWAGEFLF